MDTEESRFPFGGSSSQNSRRAVSDRCVSAETSERLKNRRRDRIIVTRHLETSGYRTEGSFETNQRFRREEPETNAPSEYRHMRWNNANVSLPQEKVQKERRAQILPRKSSPKTLPKRLRHRFITSLPTSAIPYRECWN